MHLCWEMAEQAIASLPFVPMMGTSLHDASQLILLDGNERFRLNSAG